MSGPETPKESLSSGELYLQFKKERDPEKRAKIVGQWSLDECNAVLIELDSDKDPLKSNALRLMLTNAIDRKKLVHSVDVSPGNDKDPILQLVQLDKEIAPLEEAIAISLVEKLMPTQFDVAEKIKVASPSEVQTEAMNIVAIALRNRNTIRMQAFINCMDSGEEQGSYERLLAMLYPGEKVTKKRLLGTEFTVYFLKKFRPLMEEHARAAGVNLGKLALDQALVSVAHSDRLMGVMSDTKLKLKEYFITKKPLDFDFTQIREMFRDRTIYPQHVVGAAFYSISGNEKRIEDLNATERQEFLNDTEKVTAFFTTQHAGDIFLNQIENKKLYGEWFTREGAIKKEYKNAFDMVQRLAAEVRSKQMRDRILKALLIKETGRNRDEEMIATKIDDLILKGNLRLDDSYQLYLLEKTNNVPLFIFKAIDLLKRYAKPGTWEATLAQSRYMEIADGFSGAALEDLKLNEWMERFNVSEEVAREMRNMGMFLEEAAENVIWEQILRFFSLWKYNPGWAVILSFPVSVPLTIRTAAFFYCSERNWKRVNIFLRNYQDTSDADFEKKYGSSKNDARSLVEQLNILDTRRNTIGTFFKVWKWPEKRGYAKRVDRLISEFEARQALLNAARKSPFQQNVPQRAADAGKGGVKPVESDPNADTGKGKKGGPNADTKGRGGRKG
jgi:hypothetical protein